MKLTAHQWRFIVSSLAVVEQLPGIKESDKAEAYRIKQEIKHMIEASGGWERLKEVCG